jgi:hypothetical protein
MSLHLNLSTGKFLNSSTLFKLSDALLLDVSSGEIVMSNLLVPRAGVDLFKLASLDLNFSQYKSLTDRVSGNNLITFTRASSGTYVDSDGLIKTAVTDAPRFDHDPVTGESLGLLIEEERTNLLVRSQQFDQSAWYKGGSFIYSQVQNAALAPDGTQTAEEYQNLSTGGNVLEQVISVSAQPYVFSVYLKAKTASDVGKSVLIGGHLSAGTHLREAVQLPAEWTRFTKTGTTTSAAWIWGIDGRTSGTFTGINVTKEESRFYIWGAQLEEGSFPTSYIPTTTSTVTRSPDLATIEGTNFSSWYNQSEGTVFVKVLDAAHDSADSYEISNGNVNNRRTIRIDVNASKVRRTIAGAGFTSQQSSETNYTGYPVSFKAAATDNFKFFVDGVSGSAGDANALPTNMTQLSIGFRETQSSDYLNGHIARLAYFPVRKTDQELIDLTTDNRVYSYGQAITNYPHDLGALPSVVTRYIDLENEYYANAAYDLN